MGEGVESGPTPPSPSKCWPWTLWGITTFSCLALQVTLLGAIWAARTWYGQLQMKDLPLLTYWVLEGGPFLWTVVIGAAGYGAFGILKRPGHWILYWSLATALLVIGLFALMIHALLYPFQFVNTQ